MIKVLFICHGNICRSPMAEFILKDMVKKAGRERDFVIASCATSTEEIFNGIGNPVYPPARAELARHGLSCEGKRAVQLQKSDYEKYDLLLCMDKNNVRNAMRILGSDPYGKVHRLMEYTSRCADVADPWYTEDFSAAWRDIYEGCEGLLNTIL